MIEGTPLAVTVFKEAFVIGMVSLLLHVMEGLAIWCLWPLAFRFGIRVLNEEGRLPCIHPGAPIGEIVETETGKYRFVNWNECLFRVRSRIIGLRGSKPYILPFKKRIVTPFPIKGVITWRGTHSRVTGRIPLFMPIFMLAWAIGWSVPAVLIITANGAIVAGGALLLFGWFAVAGFFIFSLPFEIRRARTVVRELERDLKSWSA